LNGATKAALNFPLNDLRTQQRWRKSYRLGKRTQR
jgi:hypothetical protein